MDDTSPAPERSFITYLRQRWQELRNLSHGAAASLANVGDAHEATFECAVKLKSIDPQFYSEKDGYPRFVVPNQHVHKLLALVPCTVALLDYASLGTGVCKPVTLYVVKPAKAQVFYADLSEVERRVVAAHLPAKVDEPEGTARPNKWEPQKQDIPKRTVRERGEAQASFSEIMDKAKEDQAAGKKTTYHASPVVTGRFRCDRPNKSNTMKPGQKKVIRER